MIEHRAMIEAEKYAISAGHELATQAGLDVLDNGGNAVDAGVAAGIALGVLHSDLVNFAGVAPIMIRMADTGEVVTIDGLGVWPKAASVEFFETHYGGDMPTGIHRTVVPAAPAAWIAALDRFGTMRYGDVAKYALQYAREGFPVFPVFANFIKTNMDAYQQRPANAEIYLPNGKLPLVGDTFVQKDLAATIQYMIDQEAATKGDRRAGLRAARDAFYKGDIAAKIADYHAQNEGFLTRDDLAAYDVRFEAPLKAPFGDIDVYACGAWCQGISLAQAVQMLDGMDTADLRHNSADYIHTLTEVFKLTFADREAYVADPAFVDVPVKEMLSDDYLAKRRQQIDPTRAYAEMPPAGELKSTGAGSASALRAQPGNPSADDPHDTLPRDAKHLSDPGSADTSYVAVIDSAGNMFSATPSDTSADAVVIPGTGICPSSRGSQSRGTRDSINAVAPGKRPRLTPNPALAIKDDKPLMAFGTPGGDVQIQAMIQVFLNAYAFDMDIQSAVEAPRFATYSFPSSFAPNTYHPGLLMIEESVPDDVFDDLITRGHKAERWPDGIYKAGSVLAVQFDQKQSRLKAGADPRRAGAAQGR